MTRSKKRSVIVHTIPLGESTDSDSDDSHTDSCSDSQSECRSSSKSSSESDSCSDSDEEEPQPQHHHPTCATPLVQFDHTTDWEPNQNVTLSYERRPACVEVTTTQTTSTPGVKYQLCLQPNTAYTLHVYGKAGRLQNAFIWAMDMQTKKRLTTNYQFLSHSWCWNAATFTTLSCKQKATVALGVLFTNPAANDRFCIRTAILTTTHPRHPPLEPPRRRCRGLVTCNL